MNQAPIPTYASHLPVLAALIDRHDVKTVMEFGMGLASTPLFLHCCDHVVSIEMNSQEWFNFLVGIYQCARWTPYYFPVLSSVEVMIFPASDLVLVDGHGDSRPEQIEAATKISKLIVVHDVQEPSYGWDRVKLPPGWTWTNVDTGAAQTAVLEGPK